MKKYTKNIITVFLSAIMVFALCGGVFAADTNLAPNEDCADGAARADEAKSTYTKPE